MGLGTDNDARRQKRREVASWLVLIGMVLFGTVGFLAVVEGIFLSEDRLIITTAKEHFAVVVGLPAALIAALFVVSIFEITIGPIEFEACGFKFRGASGPIVFWVICFLAIGGSIKLLW